MNKAELILENGLRMEGLSFGYEAACSGELVFSTSMVGYPESLTDPSYEGQILCVSYPIIGNYGIPAMERDEWGVCLGFESERIHVRGLVISDYSMKFSHFDAVKSLGQWLQEEGIPAICGIDTRHLTQLLRDNGTLAASIVPWQPQVAPSPTASLRFAPPISDGSLPLSRGWRRSCEGAPVGCDQNLAAVVSCKEPIHYGKGAKSVVLVDCGVKHQILHCLLERGIEVLRVPWDTDINNIDADGILVSNGPGDPSACTPAIEHLRKAISGNRPIFGICLGNQLLSLAAGASTYKMKYGHRSHNQPVRMCGTDRCYITSQNHGYAVDTATLGEEWEPFFINLNDGTSEGIRHKSKPFFSVQFHPEASSGPTDTEFLFDDFISAL
ncbi:MAG: glutamine-hydrolyzing carbamoyl-phosphate synthase small subunit [Bacteroidales bacterium]|nr:glutamine-hydrolyzing carbamoyl-phosphate synthase small subunit [Bacteroidales bacterium]